MNCLRHTRTDKAKDLIGKGRLGGEQQGKGPRENCSATWLTVSGLMVMELVSGLSLATHLSWPIFSLTQGPSWWRSHLSAKMDSSEKDSGRLVGHIMDWHLLPPFGPSQILLISFRWQHRVPYGDLLLRDNSCEWLSLCLAKAGGFSQRFPNKSTIQSSIHKLPSVLPYSLWSPQPLWDNTQKQEPVQ